MDVKSSTQYPITKREIIQESIFDIMNNIKNVFKNTSTSMTTGDEIQIVIHDIKNIFKIIRTIESGVYFDYYIGIGVGVSESSPVENIPSHMYGSAFYNSRIAINQAKKENKKISFKTSHDLYDFKINTIMQLILFIKNKLTPRQKEIIFYIENNKNITQKNISSHLNITPQAVSKSILKSGYNEIKNGEKLIEQYLYEISNIQFKNQSINPDRLNSVNQPGEVYS